MKTAMDLGIWIDQREAFVVEAHGRKVIAHIESEVEDARLGGGYGGATKYMGQDASSQSKITNRRKQQLKAFFEDIIKQLPEVKSLYIIGPGETRKRFVHELANHNHLSDKVSAVEAADSMTENQMTAAVHNHFEGTRVV